MKSIEVIVLPNGQTHIETKGFLGAECRQASQFMERAMGQPVIETLTGEFHQSVEHQQSLRQGG